MKLWLLLSAGILMASCSSTPVSFTIPAQHQPVEGLFPVSSEYGEMMRAEQADAALHIVKHVRDFEGINYRWTLTEPEFRFTLRSIIGKKLYLQFTINDRTFHQTGPVTLIYEVNGKELERVEYTSAGEKLFEKPVPQEWLKEGRENRVLIRVLNPYKMPDSEERLGFLLHAVGFRQ